MAERRAEQQKVTSRTGRVEKEENATSPWYLSTVLNIITYRKHSYEQFHFTRLHQISVVSHSKIPSYKRVHLVPGAPYDNQYGMIPVLLRTTHWQYLRAIVPGRLRGAIVDIRIDPALLLNDQH